MNITERDIEILRWILEQKFMTERQVRKIFWKEVTSKSCESYRRLERLKKEAYLKTNRTRLFRTAMYITARKGIEELKKLNLSSGLGQLSDIGYANYYHDLAVTDIRIMFHLSGCTHWISERVLSKRNDLKRVLTG